MQYLMLFGLSLICLIIIMGLSILLNRVLNSQSLFQSLSLVVVLIATIAALYFSVIKSYLVSVPALLIYYKISHKKSAKNIRVYDDIEKVRNLCLRILFYFVSSFLVFNLEILVQNNDYISLHPDLSFYAGISELLFSSGIESTNVSTTLLGVNNYEFYHYFELWFTGLVARTFEIEALKALMFVTLPIFATIMLLGLHEIQEEWFGLSSRRGSIVAALLPLSFLFIFPFTVSIRHLVISRIDFPFWNPSIALDTSLKWIIVSSILLNAFMAYRKNGLGYMLRVFFIGSLAYPTILVVTIPSLLLWTIVWARKLRISLKMNVFISIAIITCSFLYTNIIADKYYLDTLSIQDSIVDYFGRDSVRLLVFIKDPLLRTLYYLVGLGPFIFIVRKYLYFDYTQEQKRILSLLIITYLIGAFGICLLKFSYDGDQLLFNLVYPLFIIFCYFSFAHGLISPKSSLSFKYSLTLLLFTVSLNLYGIYRKTESDITNRLKLKSLNIKAIHQKLEVENGINLWIADSSYFNNTRRKNIDFIVPAHNMRFYHDNYYPQCLSVDMITLSSSDMFDVGSRVLSNKFYGELVDGNRTYQEIIAKEAEEAPVCVIIHEGYFGKDSLISDLDLTLLGIIGSFEFYDFVGN